MTLGDQSQRAMWRDRELPPADVFWLNEIPPWWGLFEFWKDLYG